jgi:prepilin-type N-terminal cleavage/methylation domain-containing protein
VFVAIRICEQELAIFRILVVIIQVKMCPNRPVCESPEKERRTIMARKGFTLVELLVVIAIIALLMGILMPALSRVRQIAFRLVCGTNLSGIGKAMLVYANDFKDELPRAGGRTSTWYKESVKFDAANRQLAYSLNADGTGGNVTITSALYLLVKYAEVTPKSFVCKGDNNVKEFEPGNSTDLIQLWDFGAKGTDCCSYSYHLPYCKYPLTTSSDPGLAVAADPNPWIDSTKNWDKFNPAGTKEDIRIGNASTHQGEGQNVLFLDSHVEFTQVSFCGINEDNIYTQQAANLDVRRGLKPSGRSCEPFNRNDSLLVDDRLGPKIRSCFPGYTDVWINGRLIKISQACEGQTVGKPGNIIKALCSKQIEKVDEHEGSFECRDIYLENGNSISVVSNHRFMLDCGVWVEATHLGSGMELKSLNGPVKITKVVKRETPFEGKVYNLKVQGGEQYLVGADGIVVRDW